MSFDSLEGAITSPPQTFTKDDVAFEGEALEDAIALSVVLQDTQTAEAFYLSKGWTTLLDDADYLYRGQVKRRTWPGSDIPKSDMPMMVVLEAIERVLPALHMPLFAKNPPFIIQGTGRTTPEAARAKGHLLAWAVKQSGFKEEIRLSLKTALQYGFVVGTWGWKTDSKKVKTYQKQADGTMKRTVRELDINIPTYECLDLRRVLVDPACSTQDVRKSAKFIVKQMFITASELDELRTDESFKNVPTKDELRLILTAKSEPTTNSMTAIKSSDVRDLQAEKPDVATTADPLQQPLEILEYITPDRVITVLQRKIVIKNEDNEFGKLNFVSTAFIDVLGSAWGFGISKLLSGEQRFQVAVLNSWVDSLAMTLNPAYQEMKGTAPGAQNIKLSPGKVITNAGELKPLATPSVTTETMTALSTSDERASRRVGANTGSAMPTQAMRTSEGVQAFSGDVTQRLQYFLETFIEHIFVPVLEAFLELCADNLTPEQVNDILSEIDGKAYVGNIEDVYNATTGVEPLAGVKLAARAAAVQLAPMILQAASTAPIHDALTQGGEKFNFREFFKQTLELYGWDVDSLIVPMTADDMARAQQLNPVVAKGQQDLALQQQKHQDTLDEITEKGITQAGVGIIRQAVKSHSDAELSALERQADLGGQTPQSAQ